MKDIISILILITSLALNTTSPIENKYTKEIIEEIKNEINIKSIKINNENNLDLNSNFSNGYYNYCPTIIKEQNNYHNFYCSNENSYEVLDHIFYKKIKNINKFFFIKEETKILSPTPDSWDSVHVCDPSIIKGEFNYNGNCYNYLMTYLGCNTYDNQQNKIGIAISNNLDYGWIKINEINPLISIDYDFEHQDSFQWGVGQPSIINIDNKNKVLIFYTKGTFNKTCEMTSLWDFSDLNKPHRLWEVELSNKGTNDFISNADFVFDETNLYMICDVHPFEEGVLSNIPTKSNIYKTKITDFYSEESFLNCNWEKIKTIDKNETSFDRNHNSSILRDEYGHFIDNTIIYSYAKEKEDFLNSLWTYRFSMINF